jgi:endonuclease YncB( thermonuclease family)
MKPKYKKPLSPALITALCLSLFTFIGLSESLQAQEAPKDRQAGKDASDGLRVAKRVTGKVVGIMDGDTIAMLTSSNTTIKIRLAEIDAPEKNQAYGNKSKQALSDKLFGKEVTAMIIDTDRYGRSVAQIYLGGAGVKLERWINKEMVAEGWAWQYLKYSRSETLRAAEEKARERKSGLWADKNPVTPWDYRKPTQMKPDDEEKIQPLLKVGW